MPAPKFLWALVIVGLLPLRSSADEAERPDQPKIDAAVQKAVAYLRTYAATATGEPRQKAPWNDPAHIDELVLLTFLEAGVPTSDPDFQKLFRIMLDREFTLTERRLVYSVAFEAMILEKLDRVKFQDRIQLCAQWFVDTQCQNGQWNPQATPSPAILDLQKNLTSSIADLPVLPEGARRSNPKVVKSVEVRKIEKGGIGGDNGASAFAALGLRACHDAGVVIPKDVLTKARQWWCESQAGHARGIATEGMGWCYCEKRNPKVSCGAAYGSATAGGVAALAIYDHLLGRDVAQNTHVEQGVAWLASQPSLMQKQDWYYSYLFSLHNAGTLLDAERFGQWNWYREGSKRLLATQMENGAWPQHHPPHEWLRLSDTCFAVLFLKRAARPFDRNGN